MKDQQSARDQKPYSKLNDDEKEFFRITYNRLVAETPIWTNLRAGMLGTYLTLFGVAIAFAQGSPLAIFGVIIISTGFAVSINQADRKLGENSREFVELELAVGGDFLPYAHDYNIRKLEGSHKEPETRLGKLIFNAIPKSWGIHAGILLVLSSTQIFALVLGLQAHDKFPLGEFIFLVTVSIVVILATPLALSRYRPTFVVSSTDTGTK